jgi:3D (Asp-Asp-Asp) domain-containing protein
MVFSSTAAPGAAENRNETSGRNDQGRPVWYARVGGTGGTGLVVRSGPGLNFPVQITLGDGARVRVVEGPRFDAQLRDWYLVVYDRTGSSGWSSSEYLLVAETFGPELPDPIVAALPPAPPLAADRLLASGATTVRATIQARLTAYTNQPPGGGAHGTITRSGTHVRWGVVAVDPQVIPLGTRMMIEGFDTIFVAEDTGGGVRGPHVDIYFPDYYSAVQFGVQYRAVAILD